MGKTIRKSFDITREQKGLTEFINKCLDSEDHFELKDAQCRGLYLRGQFSKARGLHSIGWYVRGRIKVRGASKINPTNLRICRHDFKRWRATEIREAAENAKQQMRAGHNPERLLREFEAGRELAPEIDESERTFDDIRREYLAYIAADPDKSADTHDDYRQTLFNGVYVRKLIPDNTRASQLDKALLQAPALAAFHDGKQSQARKISAVLNAMQKWLQNHGAHLAVELPRVSTYKKPKAQNRYPILEQVRVAYQRLCTRRLKYRHHPSAIAAARLVLLTCQRIYTVRHAEAASIEDEDGYRVWVMDDEFLKSGSDIRGQHQFLLPLVDETEELFRTARSEYAKGRWMFPALRKHDSGTEDDPDSPLNKKIFPVISYAAVETALKDAARKSSLELADPKEAEIDTPEKASGRPIERKYHFTPHDLRRSIRTFGVKDLKINFIALERVLAHKYGQQGVGEHYDRAQYLPEKYKALQKWTEAITTPPKIDPLDVEGARCGGFFVQNNRSLYEDA